MVTAEKRNYRKELLKNCFIVKVSKKAMETLLYVSKIHSCFIRGDEPMSDLIGVYNIGSDHYYVCEAEKMGMKIE